MVVTTPLAEQEKLSSSDRRERKDKKRLHGNTGAPDRGSSVGVDGDTHHRKERDRYLGQDGHANSGDGKEDQHKRKLEEGELDENSKEYKRLHGDGRTLRDKKWDDYPDRTGNMRGVMPRGSAPGTPQGMRGGMYPDGGGRSAPYPDDRWSGRDRFSDHKRDRYDGYNRHPPSNYHRDHRDRDRGDRQYKDKRRYPPPPGGYSNNHYGMPPGGYYPPGDNPYRYAAGYDRGGGGPSGGGPGGAEFMDYRIGGGNAGGGRGEYERRQPPSANS